VQALVLGDVLCGALTGSSTSLAFCEGMREDSKNLVIVGLTTARADSAFADIWELMNDVV